MQLIQLSADTRTLLDLNRSTADSKLTGMQLHHFGAFYKRSWRANDWMWGRLDGAGWLVHLLLDPRRINAIAATADGSRVAGFLNQLATIGVPTPPDGDGIVVSPPDAPQSQWLNRRTIAAELAYLDDETAPVPASLPLTALWVARGLQQRVAAAELVAVAGAVLDPDADGVHETPSAMARNWATQVSRTAPEQLVADAGPLLSSCPVPDETLSAELGSPLMVRTVAKTVAVTTAALQSMPQLPPVVRPLTGTLRTVTLAGYRVIGLARAMPRRMILAGLVLLLIGGALATGQSTLFGLTGLLVAGTGGYLVVFGAWQTSREVLGAVVAATVVGGLAALTVPSVRHGLFGTADGQSGWLGDRVLWLGENWWHPLMGVLLVAVLLAAAGLLLGRSSRGELASRLPRWLAVGLAAVVALATVALLAVLLAVRGS